MNRDRTYLLDILEAAKLAISYVENKDEEAFLADIQCQDAVIRRFEIIGEAARRISDEFRLAHPQLPWTEMIGMRNLLIHEYADVDLHIVRRTVIRELPTIVDKIKACRHDRAFSLHGVFIIANRASDGSQRAKARKGFSAVSWRMVASSTPTARSFGRKTSLR